MSQPPRTPVNLQARMPHPSEVLDKTTVSLPRAAASPMTKCDPKWIPETTDDVLYRIIWLAQKCFESAYLGNIKAGQELNKHILGFNSDIEQFLNTALKGGLIDETHKNYLLANLPRVHNSVAHFTIMYSKKSGKPITRWSSGEADEDSILFACMNVMALIKQSPEWQSMRFYNVAHPANRGQAYYKVNKEYETDYGDTKLPKDWKPGDPFRPGGARL